MEIVSIFAIIEGSLYAVQYDGKSYDEFKTIFDQWQDIEYLEQFFEDNKNDLENGIYNHLSIEDAVNKTIDETSFFELKVLAAAKNSLSNPEAKITLEKAVFHSLHKEVYNNDYIESKAYGTKTNLVKNIRYKIM
ncbi:MAG: hypothetical protein COA97_12835 [Flavobacteriales bacterium]|nr:MAG: hypothetical protein COA97_12835 [Flavobacteriales bacterium]